MIIDANVQPHFRYNAEIRRYLPPEHKLRAIPDVEQQWYQAPGGDYRRDLHGDGYPGSDPDTVARHLFDEGGARCAILNPLTRGNIADYLLNSRICAAVNDWLLDRWLEPDGTDRFLPCARSKGSPIIRNWCRSASRCSRGSRMGNRCSSRSGKR